MPDLRRAWRLGHGAVLFRPGHWRRTGSSHQQPRQASWLASSSPGFKLVLRARTNLKFKPTSSLRRPLPATQAVSAGSARWQVRRGLGSSAEGLRLPPGYCWQVQVRGQPSELLC